MTAAIIITSATALVLVVLLAAAVSDARDHRAAHQQLLADHAASGYRALVGKTVTASVADGGSIRGVLVAVYDDSIVLEHPSYIAGARPAEIGERVTLDRSRVAMLQQFAETSG